MPRRPVRVTSRPAAPAGFRPVGYRPAAAASSRPRRPAARAVRAVQAGFSLIELLVVVAVLSAVAFVALDAVEGDTNAIRESATRARLEQIRRAVVGRTDLALNGQPMVSGYVADVGRLPECLEALMVQNPDCDDDGTVETVAAWGAVAGGILSHGWRGPYLVANGDNGAFVDAYGNEAGRPTMVGASSCPIPTETVTTTRWRSSPLVRTARQAAATTWP